MMQMDYFHEQIASFSSTSQCHALIRIAQRYLSHGSRFQRALSLA